MKERRKIIVFFLLFLVLFFGSGAEISARRFGREEPRFSYFGGGPLLLEYEKYSDISERATSNGFQLVGGLMWDRFGLEMRLVPETINRYRFEFDGRDEKIEMELDHRLAILAKPSFPLEGGGNPGGWLYGIVGPSFGDVNTTREEETTTIKAAETDLVLGVGASIRAAGVIYQVDWLANVNRGDRAFSGIYVGMHYIFED